jgi:3-hydroxyisobutyrate dehydrogenase-like beta-hydroxyacid dehydrogenase
MAIGFVGLGQMGSPIAMNLLKGGFDLVVSDLNESAVQPLLSLGAKGAAGDAPFANVDVLFVCLPNGRIVHDILLGDGGLLSQLSAGQIVVDLSTIDHATTAQIAQRCEALGIGFLDAPISGMVARAVDGTLTVMCGGTREVFDRARPYLQKIGDKILHMGPTGSGQLTKLVNQLLFDINAAALAEVLPFAVKLGLDPDLIGEVVNSGTGRSYASEFFIPRILRGHFADGYPMEHAYKDLVAGSKLSAEMRIPTPVLAAATATYQMALLEGLGAKDKGAMVEVFETLLGVQVRSKTAGEGDPGPKNRP